MKVFCILPCSVRNLESRLRAMRCQIACANSAEHAKMFKMHDHSQASDRRCRAGSPNKSVWRTLPRTRRIPRVHVCKFRPESLAVQAFQAIRMRCNPAKASGLNTLPGRLYTPQTGNMHVRR